MQIKTSQNKLVNIYRVTTSADNLRPCSNCQMQEKLCFREKTIWEQIIKIDVDSGFKTKLCSSPLPEALSYMVSRWRFAASV